MDQNHTAMEEEDEALVLMEEEEQTGLTQQDQRQRHAQSAGLLGSSLQQHNNNTSNNNHSHRWTNHNRPRQQPQVRVWPPVRSDPIVIGGAGGDMEVEIGNDSSSDEEDRNVAEDTRSSRDFANSLPARLLRAPVLGSLPSNHGRTDIPDTSLPPPMNLETSPAMDAGGSRPASGYSQQPQSATASRSSAGVATTSYGSLRESHLQGRFLDGPSSYRDPRTGDIRRIHQQQQLRVRFQGHNNNSNNATENDNANGQMAMSFTGTGLSIGERMMQNSQRNKTTATEATASAAESSTLSKLMESCSQDDGKPAAAPAAVPNNNSNNASTFYDHEEDDETNDQLSALPSHVLSTSLTGLEILQRGYVGQRPPGNVSPFEHVAAMQNEARNSDVPEEEVLQQQYQQQQQAIFNREELPRDSHGNNLLLSRSLSDPSPRWRERAAVAASLDPRQNPSSPLLRPNITNNHIISSRHTSASSLSMFLPPANSNSNNNIEQSNNNTSHANNAHTANTDQRQQPPSPLTGLLGVPAAATQEQGSLSISMASYQQQQQQQPAEDPLRLRRSSTDDSTAADNNPDTEAAFQLDLE